MSSYDGLKKRVFESNMDLPKKNLVTYTFGNVSGIDRDKGVVAIKPSGVPYEELTPDKIVIVDLNNKIIEGKYKPSSDTKTHLILYKAFPKIGGIVHTHSTYATAWAQAMKPILCFGTTHADHLPSEVPCTKPLSEKQIKSDYEEETGRQIIAVFKDFPYIEVEMVLVANHGPFTWGDSPKKAVYNSVILEEIAKTALLSKILNPGIKEIKKALIHKHFNRKHGKSAYYGQSKG